MGLLDLLQTQGSNLSNLNGTDGEVLQGSTDESKLHATKIGQPGYSLNGGFLPQVNQQLTQYDDGVSNTPPTPAQLDINGVTPSAPLQDNSTPIINNSFGNGTYRDSAPSEAGGRF